MTNEVKSDLPSDLIDVGDTPRSVPMDLNTLPEDARTVDPAFTAKQVSVMNPTAYGAAAGLVVPPVIKNVVENYKNPATAAPVVGSTPGHTPYNPRGVSVEKSVENWRNYSEAQNEAAKGVRRESGLHKKYPNFSRATPPAPPAPGGIVGKAGVQIPKIVNAVDAALVPHGTSFASKAFRGAGRTLQGAAAGFQAADAYNRAQAGDYPGAVISGVGALGDVATLIPSPYTRIGGTAVGVGAQALNAYLDNLRKGNIEHGAPTGEQLGVDNPMAQGGLAHLAEGGQPEFGEARAYEPSYSEKIRDLAAKYMSPQRADVLFGGPRAQTVDKLNPIGLALQTPGTIADAAQGFIDRSKEGNYPAAMGNYAVGALNTIPLVKPAGQVAKTAIRELGPKAAGMAEDYLTKIGGIQHIMPPGMTGKAAHEIDTAAPTKLSDWAQNRMNEYVVPTQADRMGGIGGPSYSANQLARKEYEGRAWGSGQPGTATMIANLAKDPRFGGTEKQNFMPLLGKENMHQSNQMIFDRMVDQFYKDPKKLPPDLAKIINDYMQTGGTITGKKAGFDPFPKFDIRDRKQIEELGKTFENRKLIGQHAFGGEGIGGRKSQIIPYEQILRETMDPTVAGAKTFSVGPRAFKLTGEVESAPRPDLNPAYPFQLYGKDSGVNIQPTPSELALIDFHNQWRKDTGKTMPLKSGSLPKPGYFEHTLGYKTSKDAPRTYPRQLVTEDWIKELQRSGMAEGGLTTLKTKKK